MIQLEGKEGASTSLGEVSRMGRESDREGGIDASGDNRGGETEAVLEEDRGKVDFL